MKIPELIDCVCLILNERRKRLNNKKRLMEGGVTRHVLSTGHKLDEVANCNDEHSPQIRAFLTCFSPWRKIQ